MAGPVQCPKCKASLYEPIFNAAGLQPCPNCSVPIQIVTFPALRKAAQTSAIGENIVVTGESSCYFHPTKRAAVSCEKCGRFICALCDVAVDGKHLCSQCLSGHVQKGTLQTLKKTGQRHDSAASACAVVCIPLIYLAIIIAPVGLYFCLKGLKQKDGLFPRKTKTLYSLAVILIMEMVGSFLLIFFSFKNS
jgi:hypothetical protein